MNRNRTITTKKIVLVGLLAALTTVGSGLRIKLPLAIAGTAAFHLGNIMCALSGILLGPWIGGLAAGLGSAIYDMTDPAYISECWITFLTKGAYGLVAGAVVWSLGSSWGYRRALLGTAGGALTYTAIYLSKSYFYNGLLLHGLTPDAAWANVLAVLPSQVFNITVALIGAPLLAVTIQQALKRAHLTLD